METKTLNRETPKQKLFTGTKNGKSNIVLYSQVVCKEGYVNIIKMFDFIKGFERGDLFHFFANFWWLKRWTIIRNQLHLQLRTFIHRFVQQWIYQAR